MSKRKPFGRNLQTYSRRQVRTREPVQRFLIVCEGEKTEPQYFRKFRVSGKVEPYVRGVGYVTLSLVKRAIELTVQNQYDQVWCVFDLDDCPKQDFNQALELAHKSGIRVAYSIEAFEIWYLLHFNYHDTGIQRHVYLEKLSECIGREYKKNSDMMYEELESRQLNAIRNAERLLASYGNANPVENNPSTTVHLLVMELRRFSR